MKLRITVEGKAYEVDVDVLDDGNGGSTPIFPVTSSATSSSSASSLAAPPSDPAPPRPAPAPAAAPVASAGNGVSSDRVIKAPIVGTIMTIKVKPGDAVQVNQILLVMEAMKMETNIASPMAGKVKSVLAAPGDAVKAGQVLVEFE